ncbi:hypothetical protein SAMN04487947_2026 [Halogeometricum rufum]|uniref:Uncharacterized protein n=1 Tax=Halogeometricum rufum TaxID=553469 RepID=A0A1I6HG01_9EURY|nr:hypothetical protein [Halogeometricum rufum]SFR53389.1 hypothetical protein SAMN04487947_2026 [Halogeometricum rufum]
MSLGWKFSRASTEDGRSGGDPAAYAFENDLEDFVRETLQNANDAGPENEDEPVSVTYHLKEYSGSDLQDLFAAVDWSEEIDGDSETEEYLKDHLQTVADSGQDDALARLLDELEDDGSLLMVTVADTNTHGLFGAEGGSGPFSALVLDDLVTENKESGAGGSYGLGKAVLWSWSGLSTVLFTSHPRDCNGNEPPRLIARTQLPSHEIDDDQYRYLGRGFFGYLDESERDVRIDSDGETRYKWGKNPGRPLSAWGDEAESIVNQIGVPTPQREGTSVSVLGFCPPGSDNQPNVEDLADDIAQEASKWFWPAMLRGSLEVNIETDSDTRVVDTTECEEVIPFVECIRSRESTVDVLDKPGDIAVTSPTFEIPDKKPGETEEEEDPATEDGPINVYARLADPERDLGLKNRVALVRGPGMVVKYYNRNRIVYGDRTFHGVVLAGNARTWNGESTQADRDIEDLLTAAEPPTHKNWEKTRNLLEKYAEDDATSCINNLQRNLITEALKSLVQVSREGGEFVAAGLAERLSLPEAGAEGGSGSGGGGGGGSGGGGGGGGGGGSPTVTGDRSVTFDHNEGRWSFEGDINVGVHPHGIWELRVTIQQLSEEGNVIDQIPVGVVSCGNDDVYVDDTGSEALLRAPTHVDTIKFIGRTVVDRERLQTRLNINATVQEVDES